MNNGTSRSQGLAVGQALLILALLIWFWLAPIIATWLGQLLAEALDLASISGFSLIGITALWAPPLLGVLFFSRRRAGWRPVAATVAVLAIASGFALLDAIVKAVISEVTMLQAMLRLALLLPYTLFAMRFVPALVQEVSREHRFVGLERGNRTALWAALALAALATLPWPVTGALGDSLASAAILVQTLAGSVPVIFLVWGLAFTFLTSIYRRGWAAALVTLALYGGLMMARVLPSGNWDALGNAFAVLPLGLLLTELRARNGGLLALLALALPYSLLPQLFVDPRDIAMQGVPELQHILAYIVIWSFTGLSGIILWGVRQIVNYRARERIKPAFQWRTFTLLAAGACWVLWGGLYLLVGSPGFANDSFLIIMEEQTDLSFAQNASEREARIAAVREALIATAERTQAPIRSDLERRGLAYRPYYIINMIRVETNSPRLARQLESLPGVAEVIRNPNVREYLYRIPIPYGSDTEPAPEIQENLAAIHANAAWNLGIWGDGIVVAGQDSGYDWTHPVLQPHYRGWDGTTATHAYNWHDAWDHTAVPFDDDAHGTHTMGTVLGDDGAGNRTGVAPQARWIGCRNMRRGFGNPGAYAECMEFFLAPFPNGGDPFTDGDVSQAPHVINNSWGCPTIEGCFADTLQPAAEALRAAGIMMVVSAGNEGPGCRTVADPPANYDAVFSVGATTLSGDVTGFSSRGPAGELLKPDVSAPGEYIRSSVPGGGFGYAGGTSMAGPHVAGLVALLWSADPDLAGDIDATEALICQTAVPKSVSATCDTVPSGESAFAFLEPNACACGGVTGVPNNVYGCGIIDAGAAVRAALGLHEP